MQSEAVRDPPAPTQKKLGRRKNPYARTGCQTCKIRHLKCDEQRPACRRCVSTGRKCDGYAANSAQQSSAAKSMAMVGPKQTDQNSLAITSRFKKCQAISFAVPFQDIPGDPRERRSWSYFYHQTAPILAGYSDYDFWNRSLLQIGHSEPILRHAMIAVSVIHECASRLGNLPIDSRDSQIESDYHFALENYNKAIGHLRARSNTGASSVEIILMVCILFVCLEFLQHNQKNVLRHMQNGLKILSSLEDEELKDSEEAAGVQLLPARTHIDNKVVHILLRLATQCKFIGLEYTFPVKSLAGPAPTFGPLIFSSLMEAKEAMDRLTDDLLNFVYETDRIKYDLFPDPVYVTKQSDATRDLDWWLFSFESFLQVSKVALSPLEIEAIKSMRIHHKICSIWVSTALSPLETAFDSHLADFGAVVVLAESMDQNPTNYGTFSFEIGANPPVYFVAIKCRHPTLRRRAIKILSSQRRQESHWHSHQMASLASRIMTIEEAQIPAGLAPDQYGPGSIPDGIRVCDTHIDPPLYNPPRSRVIFKTKPQGPYAEWVMWEEDILWKPAVE